MISTYIQSGQRALALPPDLLSKIDLDGDGGCWLWKGYVSPRGYGFAGRHTRAHRMVYETLVGPIPTGLQLDHLCRTRCCVNPDHLEPVTSIENVHRGLVGARMLAKTECPVGHPYAGSNLYVNPAGWRECRACRARRRRAYRTARKAERKGQRTCSQHTGH